MKQTNLAVFIPHKGCPNDCAFCNQRIISGSSAAPTAKELSAILAAQQPLLQANSLSAEIAFFGGSFTAVDKAYRRELLLAASEYVANFPEQYAGIRCSTRPDCIDEEILDELQMFGVTAIELGAQSMNDTVLQANRRGHTAQDVRTAAMLIKSRKIELGLQMMTGLYLDEPLFCLDTAREFRELGADTVRIYPTVILRGTYLDSLREKGLYKSFSFEQTIDLCARLVLFFRKANIPVIRLGLHASQGVENQQTGGVYHPALGEIVESRIMLNDLLLQISRLQGNRLIIYSDKKYMSLVAGHGGVNKAELTRLGYSYKIKEEKNARPRVEIA